MFRKNLLLTTAFVAAAALPSVAALARPAAAGLGHDSNDEFMCTYGQLAPSANAESSSTTYSSGWRHVAVPIVGKGKVVNRIIVKEARSASTASPEFSAGIYGDTPSRTPGKLIAGGIARAPRACGNVTIRIAPTTLKAGKTYWIEETVLTPHINGPSFQRNEVYWAINPKSRRRAYVQSYYNISNSNHSSTTPWTRQRQGVYLRVK
jgi:hypothetical protein